MEMRVILSICFFKYLRPLRRFGRFANISSCHADVLVLLGDLETRFQRMYPEKIQCPLTLKCLWVLLLLLLFAVVWVTVGADDIGECAAAYGRQKVSQTSERYEELFLASTLQSFLLFL